MPQMYKLSNYATTVADHDGKTCVTYHSTCIVEWTNKTITLRSGGWETVTTKRKMNQAANQFNLGFQVFQKSYEWFVTTRDGQTRPFIDGMALSRHADSV